MKKGFRIIKFKKDKPIFEIKNISKSFDGRPILKKISIAVVKKLKSFCKEKHVIYDIKYLLKAEESDGRL